MAPILQFATSGVHRQCAIDGYHQKSVLACRRISLKCSDNRIFSEVRPVAASLSARA